MPKLPLSGLNYPNIFVRNIIDSIEQVIGKDALDAILLESGMEQYVHAYPPNNMERAFDFADMSALCAGVEALDHAHPVNGNPWSRTEEMARLSYRRALREFGALAGFSQVTLGFQVLPEELRVKMGLIGMATIFTTLSDQHTEVEDRGDYFEYIIHQCPVCWGRHSDAPCCVLASAMIEEGIFWLTKRHFKVYETECIAAGGQNCIIRIDKAGK